MVSSPAPTCTRYEKLDKGCEGYKKEKLVVVIVGGGGSNSSSILVKIQNIVKY